MSSIFSPSTPDIPEPPKPPPPPPVVTAADVETGDITDAKAKSAKRGGKSRARQKLLGTLSAKTGAKKSMTKSLLGD